ncbi:MAG: endolytic transglycosylase MltG [Candidatus Binatia bacterium]
MRRALLGAFVALAAMAALGAATAWWAWRMLNTAPRTAPAAVVYVPPGEPFRAVAARLHAAGVVAYPRLLGAWARVTGLDRSVRSGEFRFDEPLTPIEILALLRSPAESARVLTVPEGRTAEQIAALLEERGYGGRDVFLCVMQDPALLLEFRLPASGVEGYLFPDTYAFDLATPPNEIVRAMLGRFRQQTGDLASRRPADMSEAAMVTLASVIEKEASLAAERGLISGVFHNRLRLGMPLQSDPTVLYGRRDGRGPITRADLSDSNPYNTYVHRGLPPGPIANPGRAALEAAVAPAPTNALYFVARNDGGHEFSETLDAHNRAVRKFQPDRD